MLLIRFDFNVNQTAENGVSVPYALLTAALLENDVFKNVQLTNARMVNDGDRTIVLGIALSGLKDKLDIGCEELSFEDGFELPEYVQIEADVTNFALPVTLVLASSEVFAALDADELEGSQELKDAMTKLTDGMAQLLEGGAQLVDGLAALDTGVEQLAGGVDALAEGLDTLVSNNDALVAGSAQVFASLLATANAQLAAADAGVPELTIENYDETLAALLEAMSEDGIARQARQQVEAAVRSQQEQVRAAVEQAVQAQAPAQLSSEELQALIDERTEEQLQTLIEQSMASDEVQAQMEQSLAQYQESRMSLAALREQLNAYNSFHSGVIAYTEGAASAADGANQLKAGMPSLADGVQQLLNGAQALKNGLELFSDEGVAKLDKLVSEDMEQLLNRVRELILAAQSSQNYSGMADGMDASLRFIWRTDAIEG